MNRGGKEEFVWGIDQERGAKAKIERGCPPPLVEVNTLGFEVRK